MRVVIQRTSGASVTVDGRIVATLDHGFVILLGIEAEDGPEDVGWLVGKILNLRVFADEQGKMNRSLCETGGGAIVVSQFTLHASTKKGNRPSFLRAAGHTHSEPLYEAFCAAMDSGLGKPVGRGIFGADMKVALVNDGPVTILIDSRARE